MLFGTELPCFKHGFDVFQGVQVSMVCPLKLRHAHIFLRQQGLDVRVGPDLGCRGETASLYAPG